MSLIGGIMNKYIALTLVVLFSSTVSSEAAVPTGILAPSYVHPDYIAMEQLRPTKDIIVITKKDIQENGYTSISEALTRQTGINVGLTGEGSIDIRGQGDQYADSNIQVLVDGVPITTLVNHSIKAGNNGASGTGVAGKGNSHGLGAGFVDNGDGTYTANANAMLSYRIIRDAKVVYPEEARSIGYAKTVVVHARILVGVNGKVEVVQIVSRTPNLGFKEAAESALWNMQFAPIIYKGYKIKMYFQKTIYFQP